MEFEKYKSCIEACNVCAVYCDSCATACLQEDDVKMMAECIRLDIQCAQICRLAASFMAQEVNMPRISAVYVLIFVRHAAMNAPSTMPNIARSALKYVIVAPMSALLWLPENA